VNAGETADILDPEMGIESLIQQVRELLQASEGSPKDVAIQLLDVGYTPDRIALVVRAAVTLGPRLVRYHGEKGACPSCGTPGTFDWYAGPDMPSDWISLENSECHACMWENILWGAPESIRNTK